MTEPRRGASSRPSRGDLLAMVAADLAGWRVERRGLGRAVATPPQGPACLLEVREERRKLMRLATTVVHIDGPATDASCRLVLHHTGQLRRRALAVKVKGDDPDQEGVRLGERLLEGGALQEASLALDFTSFVVAPTAGWWRASVELMGGSHVWTRLPPGGSYVRLAPDQVAALAATLTVLEARLPGRPVVRDDGEALPPTSRRGHLPNRRR